jgi:hypothetical protein
MGAAGIGRLEIGLSSSYLVPRLRFREESKSRRSAKAEIAVESIVSSLSGLGTLNTCGLS